MCGIAGIINFSKLPVEKKEIENITRMVAHRGPDDEDFYFDQNLAFGHRRLSIIDLSPAGAQPMSYQDKSVITFNGEIYNYIEIKEQLIALHYHFCTHTDTEVILAAYDAWGADCVNKFNGMWSFAIHDKIKNIIFCSRDRFGVKPFYYTIVQNKFVFGSEIKQLLYFYDKVRANRTILLDYLVMNMTDHTDQTFFDHIYTLRGGHNMIFDLSENTFKIKKYYQIKFNEQINQLSLEDSKSLFKQEFDRAVDWRLRSDVKVGTCLSGGLDSSKIAAVASKKCYSQSAEPFCAVTAQSVDEKVNEIKYSKLVSNHLGLNLFVTAPGEKDFFEYLDQCIKIQEEPFGGPSAIFQFFVMKQAKEAGIKVLLDGQGGDESLLGYVRYIGAYIKSLPFKKKMRFILEANRKYGLSSWQLLKSYLYFTSSYVRKFWVLRRIKAVKKEYLDLVQTNMIHRLAEAQRSIFGLQIMEITSTQIPQLLKLEDKNSMANSIETRLPFMDWSMVETNLSINNNYKIYDGWSKYILRISMEGELPDEIAWRRKKLGFNAPSEVWLKDKNKFWEDIDKSSILKEIFNEKIHRIDNEWVMWRLFNIAKWENIYNVQW